MFRGYKRFLLWTRYKSGRRRLKFNTAELTEYFLKACKLIHDRTEIVRLRAHFEGQITRFDN